MTAPAMPDESLSYAASIEHLVGVIEKLSQAHDLQRIMDIVRKEARVLTGADGATFVLRDDDKCFYAEEDAISPLWRGQRFPMKSCISGWVMMNATPAICEDIYADPRIPHDAYRPTFVKSLIMVPIRKEKPIGAIGNYWAAPHKPSEGQVALLQMLADAASIAIENVGLYRQLQDKIAALQKSNQELERFIYIVSHDLKTPLRSVSYRAQWIEDTLSNTLSPENQENFARLRQQILRMESMLNDLLDYARLGYPSDEGFNRLTDGTELFREILDLVDVPSGFTVKASSAFLNDVNVPMGPLRQILCNLVVNAIKHHDRKTGMVEIDVEDRGSHYAFSVSDDGPGIPAADRQKIFDVLQTLKPRSRTSGSGIGLALVKKVLQGVGDITVEDAKPHGAVFRFTWPKPLGTLPG